MTWTETVRRNVQLHGELVAGIDPFLPEIPACFESVDAEKGWLAPYLKFVLSLIRDRVGFVKFQAAYFEALGLEGLNALAEAMSTAQTHGLGVILDAKRGDIGSTAAAYARAYLTPKSAGGGGDFEADCLTVNPYMGPDTLEPYLDCVRAYGKGLFILCRTSNSGGAWLQDRMCGNRQISHHVADLVASLATDTVDDQGLSPIGAVIGATVPAEGARLRQVMPSSIILAPGVGAQGADPGQIRALRGKNIGDVLVPVSRGLFRVDGRDISDEAYAELILKRINTLKADLAANGD